MPESAGILEHPWDGIRRYGVYYNRHHKRRKFFTYVEMTGWIREGLKQEAENRKVSLERVCKEYLRQWGYDPQVFLKTH
ncbi:MAG: hypothetical protein Q8Q46_00235 [Candidatus Giovannonibacteria bacterium]|nr:hypothetical protein [Candidatus Giovannonibacteria bacterium]